MTTINELLRATEPTTCKTEYWGNGKNGYYGGEMIIAEVENHTIAAEDEIRRYSYRWHKRLWCYEIDGQKFYHRSTFKAALRRIGVEC